MFEIVKLMWDVVALRDASRKGLLEWRIWPMAFGFVAVLYGVGLFGWLFYEHHPQYKPVFVAAMIFDGVFYVWFLVWAYRWQSRRAAARKAALTAQSSE
jgi:membrane protein YdbS with pleckstrin-like domain